MMERSKKSELNEGVVGNRNKEKNYRQLKSNYGGTASILAAEADNKSSLCALTVGNRHICNWYKLVISAAFKFQCVCVCVCVNMLKKLLVFSLM